MSHTVLTLICNPLEPLLGDEFAEQLSRHIESQGFGISQRSVLSPQIAEDYFFPDGIAPTQLVVKARKFIGNRPIDAVAQKAAHRKKRLLIADMDSTIIEQECIDELAEFAGKRAEISAITERAMRGELDFEAALKERVTMLAGLPETVLQETFEKRISLTAGAKSLIATMNAAQAMTALISGGFTFFTARVAEQCGFRHHQANILHTKNAVLTGSVAEPILGRAAKEAALTSIANTQAIALAETMAVGDGANDLSMLQKAGLGVAFHAKPAVAKAAGARIDHGDLTALLFIQGYGAADFQ